MPKEISEKEAANEKANEEKIGEMVKDEGNDEDSESQLNSAVHEVLKQEEREMDGSVSDETTYRGWTDLGCWKDSGSNRAIPTLEGTDSRLDGGDYKSRKDAINKCYQVAKASRLMLFAIQDGGWCAGAINMDGYKKYGASNGCRGDGKGGIGANRVYKIIEKKKKKKISPLISKLIVYIVKNYLKGTKTKKNDCNLGKDVGELSSKVDALQKKYDSAKIPKWPSGHYCILVNGNCPSGFLRYEGFMKALYVFSGNNGYMKQVSFGSSRINCHTDNCARKDHWLGDLVIVTCCK